MTTTAPSTALVMIQPAFTDAERLALAGFPAGYRGLTREAYRWTCASSPPGAAPAPWPCSRSAEPASSRSPGSWRPGPGPRQPGPARYLHRRRLRRRRCTVKAYRPGDAPPDRGSHRQAELPAAADAYYHHPAVTHRDLTANANRLSGRS